MSALRDHIRGGLAALSFLTRLAPAARVDESALARAMAWLPAVGALLGILVVVPLWLGILSSFPMVQAWLAVLLSVWLTRALHLDGLGDVCDGMAAHLAPDRFWEITKDSRAGAFAVIGLVLALGGQMVMLGELFSAGMYGQALFAFIMGRGCAVVLGFFGRHLSRPGLGATFLAGATPGALAFALGCTLAAGLALATLPELLGALIGAAHFQFALFALARRVQGLNGDFLGASIVSGELGAMIGMLVAAA